MSLLKNQRRKKTWKCQECGKQFPEDVRHYHVEPESPLPTPDHDKPKREHPVTRLQYETMEFIAKWQKMGGVQHTEICLRVSNCYRKANKNTGQPQFSSFQKFVLRPLMYKGMIEHSKLHGMEHKYVLTRQGLLYLKNVAKPL